MAESEPSTLFRPVNQSLGQQPTLGPIPANLLAPSGGILVSFYVLVEVILGLGFLLFLLLSVWGISTWWVVVGEKTWTFTNKFVSVPDWKRGHVLYQPRLPHHYE
jgi:hypothetical protein